MKRIKYLPRRHWTPRYLLDRVLEGQYRRRHPDEPWLTQDVIPILDGWLRNTDVAAEFGSGRSTAWFAARVGQLTSIEHDSSWYERVRPQVAPLPNVTYRLAVNEAEYVGAAREFPADSLDFALVDGEYRDLCAETMLTAVKPGGLLAIDNANWFLAAPGTRSPYQLRQRTPVWERVEAQLASWRRIWTTNGVTDTALYVRPGVSSPADIVGRDQQQNGE